MTLLPINLCGLNGYSVKTDKINPALCLRYVARRHLVFGITSFVLVTFLLRRLYFREAFPSLAKNYHEHELALPQHHWHAASHEDEPKFLFIPGHSRGSGWGNIWQEILLNAYLAHRSNRAFAFYNYTWNDDASQDYSDYAGKPIPSRVLSALIAGPMVGGAFPGTDQHAPLSVAEEYYHVVCNGRKRVLDREEVHKDVESWMVDPITEGWLRKLRTVDDQCVEVEYGQGPIYNWVTFGDKDAMHNAWAGFATSPIITFRWSALVEPAFNNNREVIAPTAVTEPPVSALPYDTPNAVRYAPIPGLLVLHLRRGDYAGHCEHLTKWSSTFLAFNALPGLEDFTPPPGGAPWGEHTPENTALYRRRCLPAIEEIVARVREVQQAAPGRAAQGLENVYIMTNGAREWVQELKGALVEMGAGFKHVASSRDTVLNWEQKYVAQAMDMLVGQRAQVLIGNGLTGGIVVMRHANGFHPDTTRFF